MSRLSYLTTAEFAILNDACIVIKDAFGATPYLVGSATRRADYRDVDIRLIQCAGACCRPDLELSIYIAEKVRVTTQFEARYDSRCDLCEAQIKVGEQMGYGDGDARVCKRHL